MRIFAKRRAQRALALVSGSLPRCLALFGVGGVRGQLVCSLVCVCHIVARPIQSKANVEPYGMEWVWRRPLLVVLGMATRACGDGGRGDALLRWRWAWRWGSRRATVLVAGCGGALICGCWASRRALVFLVASAGRLRACHGRCVALVCWRCLASVGVFFPVRVDGGSCRSVECLRG